MQPLLDHSRWRALRAHAIGYRDFSHGRLHMRLQIQPEILLHIRKHYLLFEFPEWLFQARRGPLGEQFWLLPLPPPPFGSELLPAAEHSALFLSQFLRSVGLLALFAAQLPPFFAPS